MRTVIRGGRVLDGTGRPPLVGVSVVVDDGRIVDVAGSDIDASDARIVDARGGTILPGFFDLHVHLCHVIADPSVWGLPAGRRLDDREQTLTGVLQGQAAIKAGVTTVRDTGEATPGVFLLRDLWARNALPGPRTLACGKIVCRTGGHGDWIGREADGPDEVRKATREQISAGADWIKLAATGPAHGPGAQIVATEFDEDEMAMAVNEAGKANIGVCAHAVGTDGIKTAIRAGVSTIEHGVFLDEEAIQLMLERGVYLVATLSVYKALLERGPRLGGWSAEDYSKGRGRDVLGPHSENFRRALRAGVKIAFGTDAGGPYHPVGKTSVTEEIGMMRDSGMSPMKTMESLTRVSAEALGLSDDLGTLEPGKLADVVIVDGDPLEDVSAVGRVAFVMKEGSVLKDELTHWSP